MWLFYGTTELGIYISVSPLCQNAEFPIALVEDGMVDLALFIRHQVSPNTTLTINNPPHAVTIYLAPTAGWIQANEGVMGLHYPVSILKLAISMSRISKNAFFGGQITRS